MDCIKNGLPYYHIQFDFIHLVLHARSFFASFLHPHTYTIHSRLTRQRGAAVIAGRCRMSSAASVYIYARVETETDGEKDFIYGWLCAL